MARFCSNCGEELHSANEGAERVKEFVIRFSQILEHLSKEGELEVFAQMSKHDVESLVEDLMQDLYERLDLGWGPDSHGKPRA